MLDKKITEAIDFLINKVKENNLGSIKLSNKTNSIEISNNSISTTSFQNNPDSSSSSNHTLNNNNKKNDSFISIDSPMVGIYT